jgi:hypothetical protein
MTLEKHPWLKQRLPNRRIEHISDNHAERIYFEAQESKIFFKGSENDQ